MLSLDKNPPLSASAHRTFATGHSQVFPCPPLHISVRSRSREALTRSHQSSCRICHLLLSRHREEGRAVVFLPLRCKLLFIAEHRIGPRLQSVRHEGHGCPDVSLAPLEPHHPSLALATNHAAPIPCSNISPNPLGSSEEGASSVSQNTLELLMLEVALRPFSSTIARTLPQRRALHPPLGCSHTLSEDISLFTVPFSV
jgi:hypothetical protein